MVTKRKSNNVFIWVFVGIIVLLSIGSIVVFTHLSRNYCDENCKLAEFKRGMMTGSIPQQQVHIVPSTSGTSGTYDRDLRVLKDPLYPPINRTDSGNFINTKVAIDNRDLYVGSGNDVGDSYRLVGYLKSSDETTDSGGNSWKLMARQIDRSGRGEFYITPTNNNYDVKIPITSEVLSSGYRLKEVDTIPNELRFKSPLLNEGIYQYVELPKTDLQSGTRYM